MGSRLKLLKLLEFVLEGVAVHHAGLDSGDLRKIEHAFVMGDIRVLLSTSTLAMGVSLFHHFQYLNLYFVY
jgi:ATP-dependent DNA helicase HFM1/MER3